VEVNSKKYDCLHKGKHKSMWDWFSFGLQQRNIEKMCALWYGNLILATQNHFFNVKSKDIWVHNSKTPIQKPLFGIFLKFLPLP